MKRGNFRQMQNHINNYSEKLSLALRSSAMVEIRDAWRNPKRILEA